MPAQKKFEFGDVKISCDENSRMDVLCETLKKEFPKLIMREKSAVLKWRIANWFIIIFTFGKEKNFLEFYTTTSKNCIDWSKARFDDLISGDSYQIDRCWGTLTHETVHLRQFKKYGAILMALGYLLIFFPLGLAYVRAMCEKPAYIETLRCWFIRDNEFSKTPEAMDWLVKQFTNSGYGWMWPFKKTVRGWFEKELAKLNGK